MEYEHNKLLNKIEKGNDTGIMKQNSHRAVDKAMLRNKMEARVDQKLIKTKERTNQEIVCSSKKPDRFRPKSPGDGGGLRTQKYIQSLREDSRLESQEKQKQSPLRSRSKHEQYKVMRSKSRDMSCRGSNNSSIDLRPSKQQSLRNSQSPLRNRSRSRGSAHFLQEVSHFIPIQAGEFELPERGPAKTMKMQPVRMTANSSQQSARTQHRRNPSNAPSTEAPWGYMSNTERTAIQKAETLQNETSCLRKRLDMVLEELNKVNRARTLLSRDFEDSKIEFNQIKEAMKQQNSQDPSNNQNQLLVQKIQAEKDENERLHDRISELSKIRNKVDYENLEQMAVYETQINDRKFMLEELGQKQQRIELNLEGNAGVKREIEYVDKQIDADASVFMRIDGEDKRLEEQVDAIMRERQLLFDKFVKIQDQYSKNQTITNYELLRRREEQNFDKKRLVAKVILNQLSHLLFSRKSQVMNEVREYAKFDKLCYTKLKKCSRVMFQVGQYKQRRGLQTWYDNCFKPLGTIFQNEDIAIKTGNTRLKSKTFYLWRNHYFSFKEKQLTQKTSTQQIMTRLLLNTEQEKKRMFDIWKQLTSFNKLKMKRILKLMSSNNHQSLLGAMNQWKKYAEDLESQCRLHLLQREYAQKLYLTQLFHELKKTITYQKNKRLRKQLRIFKAWSHSVSQRKQLVRQNIQALWFMSENQEMNIINIFNALKLNAVQRKHQLIRKTLDEDLDVAIIKHKAFNSEVNSNMRTSQTVRASNITRDMLGRRLYDYFKKWKEDSSSLKLAINSTLKDKMVRMYRGYLLSYFNHWKQNHAKKKVRAKKKMVMQMEQESQGMQQDSVAEGQKLRVKAEAVQSLKKKGNNKIFKKFTLRIVEQGFKRWKEMVMKAETGSKKNNKVLTRWRLRLLREAFDIYKGYVTKDRVGERNEGSAEFMKETLRIKKYRFLFEQFKDNWMTMKKAKKYWKRIIIKTDLDFKRESFRRWHEFKDKKKIKMLMDMQNDEAKTLEGMNKLNGQQDRKSVELTKSSQQIDKDLMKMAHKQIGNYLKRYYTGSLEASFKFWKGTCDQHSHKKKIMKHCIERYRQKQMEYVARAFKSFIAEEKTKKKKAAIKQTLIESEEQQQSISNSNDEINQVRERVKKQTVSSSQVVKKNKHKLGGTMDAIIKKNSKFVFGSKKRAIFENWRHAIKMEKAFALCVQNVLTKSMLMKGFHFISQASRTEKINDKKFRLINKAFLRYTKRNVGDYFTRWKLSNLIAVNEKRKRVISSFQHDSSNFDHKIEQIKNQNANNVSEVYRMKRLWRLFDAWQRVHHCLKIQKKSVEQNKDMMGSLRQRRAIQKWNMRVKATIRDRHTVKLIQVWKKKQQMRHVLRCLRGSRNTTSKLVVSLSNLGKLFSDKNIAGAFKAINSYSKNKAISKQNNLNQATVGIWNRMINNRQNQLKVGFNRYYANVQSQKSKEKTIKSVFHKMATNSYRRWFELWKGQKNKHALVEELNDTGPITSQILEANRMLRNLTEFMSEEGFEEHEIDKMVKRIDKDNFNKMHKVVKRLQVEADKRLLVKCYEAWKMWLKFRALMRHHLRNANNLVNPKLCDLQRAFNKWNLAEKKGIANLSRLNRAKLLDIATRQATTLEGLANKEGESSAMINYLTLQRDELLEQYIRSQRLALALINDNRRRGQEGALEIWKDWVAMQKRLESGGNVQAQMAQIEKLKAQMKKMQEENERIGNENDQLKGFRKDGSQLTKQLRLINKEKDKMLVLVDNKDDEIELLLQKNQALKQIVEKVEEQPDDADYNTNDSMIQQYLS